MALFPLHNRLRSVIYDTHHIGNATSLATQGQHFLQSPRSRTFSLRDLNGMSDAEVETLFRKMRWADSNGEPVCPICGTLDHWRLENQNRWKCKSCHKQFAEVMDQGQPMARMIAVQIKSTAASPYASEDDAGFTYLLRPQDLAYWRGSNLPVIVVFYRQSDDSFYWKEVGRDGDVGERRLQIDKKADVLDSSTLNKLAELTVPKTGLGYFVPPLGGGEEALVNILPITLTSASWMPMSPHANRSV